MWSWQNVEGAFNILPTLPAKQIGARIAPNNNNFKISAGLSLISTVDSPTEQNDASSKADEIGSQ
ncbi:unnamed protein product, partial [Ceratitis capitata]